MIRVLILTVIGLIPALPAHADDPYYALETRYDEIAEMKVYEDVPAPAPPTASPCSVCAQ